MSSQAPRTTHFPELDGFRALSIIAVLAAHMMPIDPFVRSGNITTAYMGMSVFFALSGFLIGRFLWYNQNIPDFFVRRIARIAPLVLLVTTLYCLLFEARVDSFIAANLYVINYWTTAINPSVSPLWSLGVEMQFYLAIGFAVLIFGRRGFWLVPIGLAIVLVCRVSTGTFGAIATHMRVDEILTGAALAVAWSNRDDPRLAPIFRILPRLFWPILILWVLSSWPPSGALGYARGYLAALLIGSVMCMQGGWQKRFLSSNPMRYIATISFALYVWHSPFRDYWFNQGSDFERYAFKRPLGLACTFTLAHLSTFYFEKPILAWARGLMRNRQAAPRQA